MVTTEEKREIHAYTNGVDTIWGESIEDAVAAYCAEMGTPESVNSPEFDPSKFRQLDDNEQLTVCNHEASSDEDGAKEAVVQRTKTVREWIEIRRAEPRPNHCICTTDW